MKADIPFLNGVYNLGGVSYKQIIKASSAVGWLPDRYNGKIAAGLTYSR